MNDINGRQFAAMLLIGDVFVLLCTGGAIGLLTVAGFMGTVIIELAIILPFAVWFRRGERLSVILRLILLAIILLWGGRLFRLQQEAAEAVYIPYESSGIAGKLLISGLIAAVCLYISSAGIKALGRSAVIAAALGAVCLIIVAVSALSRHDWENLNRNTGELTVSGELLRGLAAGGTAAGGIVLLEVTKGGYVRSALFYIGARATVTAAILLTAILITGGIMSIADHPVVTAAQLSQPFPAQRIDSLFMIVFAVYAVFGIAVQTAAAAHLLHSIFPGFERFRSLTALLLMIAVAVLF